MPERDFNTIFAERLRYYLNKYEMTQKELAKRLGVGTTSVYNWSNGIKTPRMDKVDAMCEIFNCQRSDLMQEPVQKFKTYKSVKIPVLGAVAAGEPIDAIENIEGWEDIPEDWTKHGEYFALRIQGHSMSPDIRDGDVVIVRVQPVVENGEIAIVCVNGESATCKRLKRYETELCLIPINSDYETLRFTPQEVESLPVTILGRVIEIRRKLI